MKKSICGADCSSCGFGENNNCMGCIESRGCPFGEKCFIFEYIKNGGTESYRQFKKQLTDEFNSLNIPGMPPVDELYPMNGSYVNLAYPMPNGYEMKFLSDKAVYLCNQLECEFNDGEFTRCFGLVAGLDFLLVSEYGENCRDAEIIIFKKR